jgi:hypothetical protein
MKKLLVAALAAALCTACKKTPEAPDLATFDLSATTATARTRIIVDSEINPKVRLTNTSGRQVELKWRRMNVNVPSTWEVATCDDVACHAPLVDNRVMTLADTASFEMKITFRHNGELGTGTAQIVVFDPQDSSATARVISYTATAE